MAIELYNLPIWILLPHGNQTWLAVESHPRIDEFPSYKPPFSLGIFQLATFDYRIINKGNKMTSMYAYIYIYIYCFGGI